MDLQDEFDAAIPKVMGSRRSPEENLTSTENKKPPNWLSQLFALLTLQRTRENQIMENSDETPLALL